MTEEYKSRTQKREASKKKKSDKPKAKNVAKKVFLTLLVIGFICLIGGIGTFAYWVSDAPTLDPDKLKNPVPSKIYDMNNELVAELGTEKRELVTFDEIPELVENAILATEDNRFFKHHGIDLIRLGGAVISNVTDGFGSQGASTLTQQVVKMYFLSNEKTLKRKAQEAWLAFQLEQNFSKEEIFELYVNKVNMGGNVYGIKAAAQTYFGKELDELTLPEVALIAGLPQRPNAYNPFVDPDLADERKNIVLSLMNQHGYITDKEMKEAQNTPISSLIVQEDSEDDTITDDSAYDSFVDQIIAEVEDQGYNVYSDGLEIYTTLDPSAQERVNEILNTDEYIDYPNDEIQAGVVLLDTQTGEIRAIGGGRNQKVRRGYNYAIDIERQPGSTIKPILDYGPAIEYLKYSTYTIFEDEPTTYSNGRAIMNYDDKYHGDITMRYALQKSYNIPAYKAFMAVGADKAKEFATNLGIPFEGEFTEAFSIGGFNTGIAPINLAGAYSAFGNEGVYNEPHAIRKIVLSDGETEINFETESEQVMSDYTAFMISDMLKTVVQSGTGTQAQISGVDIAGKTGTTSFSEEGKSGSPDAWFAGYSTNYTAAVWVGYQDQTTAVDDTQLPEYIFKALMSYVHEGVDTPDFTQPDSVVKLGIEKGSNPAKLASEYTPSDQIVYEYFVKGNEPSETSEKYTKVSAVTGLNADYDENSNKATLTWNYDQDIDGLSYEVYVSSDGSSQQLLQTTDKKGLDVEGLAPGLSYTFTVYAVYNDQKSDAASVTLDLSSFVQEQGTTEESQNDTTENQGNGNSNGNSNGNNGNNGNGNSDEDDDDDGSDDGNSSGNSSDSNATGSSSSNSTTNSSS